MHDVKELPFNGLIPRALESIMSQFNNNSFVSANCVLKLSFLEIYNDSISDLLNSDAKSNTNLKLKEADKLIFVAGLSEH